MMKDLAKDQTGQTVAEHIVEFLRHRGVKHVFGLCGHTKTPSQIPATWVSLEPYFKSA